jgi:cytochrome c2
VAAAVWSGENIEAGRKAYERCATCHVAPDASLAADQVWLGLVAGSA